MSSRATIGTMYVKYRTKKLELWILLKALAKLVEGFSGGRYTAFFSWIGFVAASNSSTGSECLDLERVTVAERVNLGPV